MNRRGDIPVTILVIGVFGVCALAIISFLSSGFSFSNSFDGVAVMEKANIGLEEAAFYNQPLDGLYFEVNETYFSFDPSSGFMKERVVFSVEYKEK